MLQSDIIWKWRTFHYWHAAFNFTSLNLKHTPIYNNNVSHWLPEAMPYGSLEITTRQLHDNEQNSLQRRWSLKILRVRQMMDNVTLLYPIWRTNMQLCILNQSFKDITQVHIRGKPIILKYQCQLCDKRQQFFVWRAIIIKRKLHAWLQRSIIVVIFIFYLNMNYV